MLGVISNGELAADLRDAGDKKAAGFAAFKIKVGIDKPLVDGERTRQICKLLGPGPAGLLRRQPGLEHRRGGAIRPRRRPAAGSPSSSSRCWRTTSPAWRRSQRQPTARSARTRASTAWRTSAATTSATPRKGASLKTIKLGGLQGVMAAGRLCDELQMAVNVSCKAGESSIACAAAIHIAAALPQISWGLTLSNEGLADDVTARPIRIERGHVEVSDRPGLGIDVDEDRIRRYRRDVAPKRVA